MRKMLRIIIIDDEEDSIRVLTELLKNFTSCGIKIIGTANNLNTGIEIIKNSEPDIVFLDIDMPHQKGIEIFDHFKFPTFKIIFITAYEQYAIDALNKSASGYLLKPVNFVDLQDLIKKITTEIDKEQQQQQIENNINILHIPHVNNNNIILDVENGFIIENLNNIEYCYAHQQYCVVVLHTKKEIVVSKPLKFLSELLPDNQFYRTHKSFLVNINYIRKFHRGNENYILMKSGTKIPVSVRKAKTISNDIRKMIQP